MRRTKKHRFDENICDICNEPINKQMPCRFVYHGLFGITKQNVCVACYVKFKSWVKEQKR